MLCPLGWVLSDGSCRFSVKQDTLDNVKFEILKDGTALPKLNYSFKAYMTNESTVNEEAWYTILSMNSANTISQIKLPMLKSSNIRAAVRCQHNLQAIGSITEPWRELAYTDEVPLLQDNGNNTTKITVDRLEGTADSSVSQDYIRNLGNFTRKTVGELKQAILDTIKLFPGKAFICIRVGGQLINACRNWSNDNYVIEPGAEMNTICVSNIYSNAQWAFVEIWSYAMDKYVTFISNGKWMPMKKVNLIDV